MNGLNSAVREMSARAACGPPSTGCETRSVQRVHREEIMARFRFEVEGRTAIIWMDDGENRFNPAFLSGFLDVLDTVEEETEADSLVVVSGHEKIFSNGLCCFFWS